jgi:2-oxoglutarate ferredoxin oxidoreductase subunit delta
MRLKSLRNPQSQTAHVQLDTRKCIACWKCLDACKKKIIGRVNLPWHKHARIVNAEGCNGCLSCIRQCEADAFSEIVKTEKHETHQTTKFNSIPGK